MGYRTVEELRFHDQTQSVKQKAKYNEQAATNRRTVMKGDALLLHAVHLRWDVLARQDFFNNFVFGLARSYDTLGILYQTANPPDYLVASVDAASLAFFALRQSTPSKEVSKLAIERYVAALQLVNAALANPSSSLADDTLQSILLLDLYEKLVNRNLGSPTSWMRHMNGAIALIRARGTTNLRTYVGRRLTQRLYTTLVISCAISGIRIPAELDRLRADLNTYISTEGDPKWALTNVNERIINFSYDVRSGRIQCPKRIIAQLVEFNQVVIDMDNRLPTAWYPNRVFVPNDPLGRQLTLAGMYDIYGTLYFTQVRNVMRTIQLNLLLMIEQYSSADDPDFAATTRESIEENARATCDSLTQYVVSRDSDGSLSWDLSSAMQQLGTYTILFPLYQAARASRDTHLHDWVRDVLTKIADVGGMALVQRTADALKQSAKAPPIWEVYTMLGSYAIAA